MQKNKNTNYTKVTQHKSIYIGKKREIMSIMCNRIKDGLYRVCTHSSNTDDENMNVLQLIMSLVSVYETGFVLRSLMA